MIKNIDDVVTPSPQRIIISYAIKQDIYERMKDKGSRIELFEGLNFNTESKIPTVIVIDDQMRQGMKDNIMQDLFTMGRHHQNTSIIFLTQNLFPQGKFSKDIRLNSQYIIIFKSPTFSSQIKYLGQQLYCNNPQYLHDAYIKATNGM